MSSINCTFIPDVVATEPAIAGPGVLLAFTVPPITTLLLSIRLVIEDLRNRQGAPGRPSVICRQLIHGYSMHNLAVGIALQTIALSRARILSSYHFSILWIISLASMATHNSTLLVLGPHLSKDRILRWLRQVMMLYQLVLSCTYGVFVLRIKAVALPITLPVACAWHHEFNNSAIASPAAYVPTSLTITGNCLIYGIATWYLHSRSQRYFTAAQVTGVTLMCLSAVIAVIRTLINSQAFGNPPVPLQDVSEKAWSIGQLMCVMLLGMPLVTALEIYRGEHILSLPESASLPHLDDGATTPDTTTASSQTLFWGSGAAFFGK